MSISAQLDQASEIARMKRDLDQVNREEEAYQNDEFHRAEIAQREHIAFLREQLEGKNSWLREELEAARKRIDKVSEEYGKLWQTNLKLRLALVAATREISFHNFQDDQGNSSKTDADDLGAWEELAGNG